MSEAMMMVKKPLAVLLGLTAAAVLGHFLIGPYYENVIDDGDVWVVLNWFMAVSVIVALAVSYKRIRSANGSDTKTYVGANAIFYATAAITIVFLWNWFNEMAGGGDSGRELYSIYWVLVDTTFPLVTGNAAVHLWKESSGQ